MKNIKIKLMPYETFKRKNFNGIARDLRDNTIVMIDAKLDPDEEVFIIKETMKKVSNGFSGIELSSIDLMDKEFTQLEKLKNFLIKTLGGKRRGVTIIGPSKIVRRIKKNPEDLMLYM